MSYESLLASVLEQSTPLVLAALAAMITLRANILNVAVEGMMLVSAFCAIAVGSVTGSALAGFSAGIFSAVGTSLLFSVITLRFGAGFIVAGLGINLLATGGTLFALERWPLGFPELWQVPEGSLSFIPLLGPALEGQSIIVLLTVLAVPACWVFLYRTPTGSYLRAAGEDEYAARSAGINVVRMKALAVTISGLLAGLAGAQLAMDKLHFFLPNMIAGRGFIGLAATLFGAGHPWATASAAVLFGFFGALGDRLQAFNIPAQFVLMLPYLAAILALTFARWRIHVRNKPAEL